MKMAGSTRASLRLTFQCMWGPVALLGGADPTDDAAAGQALAQLHVDLRHVAEHADEALTVIDEHRIAVEEVVAD